MIQAELLFELLVVLLDGPALVRKSHQLFKRGIRGEIGEVVFGRAIQKMGSGRVML